MEKQLAKIAISTLADEALSKAVVKSNEGFDGGHINKTDMASWLILEGARKLDSSAVEEVRQAHFNQVTYLETLVKKLKTTGRDSLAAEEVAVLQAMLSQQSTKKRVKVSKQSEPVTPEAQSRAA
jgi:hypothetical protein